MIEFFDTQWIGLRYYEELKCEDGYDTYNYPDCNRNSLHWINFVPYSDSTYSISYLKIDGNDQSICMRHGSAGHFGDKECKNTYPYVCQFDCNQPHTSCKFNFSCFFAADFDFTFTVVFGTCNSGAPLPPNYKPWIFDYAIEPNLKISVDNAKVACENDNATLMIVDSPEVFYGALKLARKYCKSQTRKPFCANTRTILLRAYESGRNGNWFARSHWDNCLCRCCLPWLMFHLVCCRRLLQQTSSLFLLCFLILHKSAYFPYPSPS